MLPRRRLKITNRRLHPLARRVETRMLKHVRLVCVDGELVVGAAYCAATELAVVAPSTGVVVTPAGWASGVVAAGVSFAGGTTVA
jgi:hypothetical protein